MSLGHTKESRKLKDASETQIDPPNDTTQTVEDKWDDEEFALVSRVLNSFYGNGIHHHRSITNARRTAFFALPSRHQTILSSPPFSFLTRFQDVEDAIDTNASVAKSFCRTGLLWSGLGALVARLDSEDEDTEEWTFDGGCPRVPGLKENPSPDDFSKASSTVRHLFREWSAEGQPERDACFAPIITYLASHFSSIPRSKRHNIRVLNPGCGLGRLVFELACEGYSAEGAEISYHMLFGAMHIMNMTTSANCMQIFPFALSGSNHVSRSSRTRAVTVPDVCPREALAAASEGCEVPGPERLGISSGDFCSVYRQEENAGAYDALVTVFFVDTARNPLAYIETAAACLKPGGVWLNLGPLKWHWEYSDGSGNRPLSPTASSSMSAPRNHSEEDRGIGEPGAVELSEEDLLQLLPLYGFEVVHYESPRQRSSGYIHDENAMESTVYHCSFWVAVKKEIQKQ